MEGGFAPGETIARVATNGLATSISVSLAEGTYYARVRGVRDGLLTAPSNEVLVVVGAARPPSAPEGLAARSVGQDVTLAWRDTFLGGAPEQVVMDVSGDAEATLPMPTGGTFTIGPVPNGTYMISLRAVNAAGSSERSRSTVVSVPGTFPAVVQGPSHPPNTSPIAVRYEAYTTPRLREFASREGLDNVLAGAPSEFEAMLRLKDWVAAQFPEGIPDPYPPWDAMTVLDWIRSGRTGGFCAQYAQVFLQALAAYGIPARYVGTGRSDNPIAHLTTEVWSNQFNKWVLLDVHFNVHFEQAGIPLSALEVHDAYVRGRDSQLSAVLGRAREGHADPLAYPHRATEFFYYLHYHLKANHISVPKGPPDDLFNDAVGWLDEHTVPWESSPVPSPLPHIKPTRVITRDRSAVELGANQVWLSLHRTGPMQMTMRIQHSVLQLHRFESRVIDSTGLPGPWRAERVPDLTWAIGPTDRAFEVRGVNVLGIAGPSSRVELRTR